MISFLRFFGLINAAVWLGTVVFFNGCVGPACLSADMNNLLGANNFPYFSGAIAQLLMEKYYLSLAIFAMIALGHLIAEWLYMGRPARKVSMGLLGGLLCLTLLGGGLIAPHLQKNHALSHAVNAPAVQRESARRSFHIWKACALAIDVLMTGGLVFYVWHVANPSDAPRFISSVKFRG